MSQNASSLTSSFIFDRISSIYHAILQDCLSLYAIAYKKMQDLLRSCMKEMIIEFLQRRV